LRTCETCAQPCRRFLNTADDVIGHIMLSHAWLDADAAMADVYVLSPLGVLPDYHGRGIGKALVKNALQEASRHSTPFVFLEGNPKYYRGSGFEPAKQHGFRRPSLRIPENAFQVIVLDKAAKLNGTLIMRDVFWQHDYVGLRK
jgi:putative acetyltransferase